MILFNAANAVITGALNALRGSGILKLDEWGMVDDTFGLPVYPKLFEADKWLKAHLSERGIKILHAAAHAVQFSLKRLIVPLMFTLPTWHATHNWGLALIAPAPYFLMIFTGTGGFMQAQKDNDTCNLANAEEFKPLDFLADRMAHIYIAARYGVSSGKRQFQFYCQAWGLAYCFLWGIIYSLPFIATNYLFGLPALLMPLFVRYLNWRLVEFSYLAMINYLFLMSLCF